MDRMTGAEFACWRQLLGLTVEEIAGTLGVTKSTILDWEADRQKAPIPYKVPRELAALKAEHDLMVGRYRDAEEVIGIVRDKSIPTDRPRGWHVAAAARALAEEPDLMVEWL